MVVLGLKKIEGNGGGVRPVSLTMPMSWSTLLVLLSVGLLIPVDTSKSTQRWGSEAHNLLTVLRII